MNAYASSDYRSNYGAGYRRNDFWQRMEDLMDTVGEEVRHAVSYVDAVVVPQARHEAASVARTLARNLDRLAEKLDPQQAQGGKQGL